jgi:hypothetical protein
MIRRDEHTFRFTAEEVHDLLNAELRRLHPELPVTETAMASICDQVDIGDGDGRFLAVDIYVDDVEPIEATTPTVSEEELADLHESLNEVIES